jgi:ATP-binding cassette subfamily F protein 3
MRKLEKMQPVAALVTQEVPDIIFQPPVKTLSPPIVALDNATVGYQPDRPVLSRLSLRVDNDDRIALLGSNGNGKSTLVKLIAGRLAPAAGGVTRADKLSVGYFAQHQLDELDPDGSVYSHIRRLMPQAAEAQVRTRAGTFGFSGPAADTPVSSLSGGEKARLLLGLSTFHGPNLIILDEPTNHLDIDSRAALAEAINGFAGAVIMVSHDRYLIDACADRLWVVAGGTVMPYDGDLDDYRRAVLSADGLRSSPRERRDRVDASKAAAPRSAPPQLARRIAAAEAEMTRISEIIAKIDAALALPDLFQRDPKQAAQLAKARTAAASALARAEDEWLTASAMDEATE